MNYPSDIHVFPMIDVNDEDFANLSHLICISEPLESIPVNYHVTEVQGYDKVVTSLYG